MSGKTNIDKVTLDFIAVYKRLKDSNMRTRRFRMEDELLDKKSRKRGRLDKINK